MKCQPVVVSLFSIITYFEPLAQPFNPIGNWRDHLPYHKTIHVLEAQGIIQAATPYSLFLIDATENSIERLSKINGLSEAGISTIAVDTLSGKVIVAYYNSNVDVLYRKDVFPIDDIKTSNVSGEKSINHIFTHDNKAYISTGFGIIAIDLEKYEVKDTYIIGNNGNKTKVNAVAADKNFLYAATEEGLKKATINSSNLSDFRNWQLESGSNGLPSGRITNVFSTANQIIVHKNDSLLSSSGTDWNLFYHDGFSITNAATSNGKILVFESGRVLVLTLMGAFERIIQGAGFIVAPLQGIFYENNYWIADSVAGLVKYNGTAFESYVPNSPYSVASGEMNTHKKVLWATAGAVSASWQPTNNKNGLFKFSDNSWTNFNSKQFPQLDSLPDFITVAIDPRDESVWAGSFGGGLINIKPDNIILIYKQNSPIQPATFSPGSYRVSGLTFDSENNLWISNYGAPQNLLVRKNDGSWKSFTVPFAITEKAVSQILIDDFNQKWIVSPNGNGLFCFSHGQSIDNPADDQWKWYRAGKGNGNLPDNDVLFVSKDKNGFLWVGTVNGVGIIHCPQEVFTPQGCEAILPVVQQDNFAGFLFSDQQVQTIAVDGADRKWVGTKNGVWLISSEGEKTIHRFTEENSPLLGNDVNQIAIDGYSGEVFFSTTKGICSFRGTATESSLDNGGVLVFPNPVPPGYTGTIAIRGLPGNAIVKITELDGRLVYQTRSLGGQAVWNGRNYKGQQISTGIYLVLVSDDSRKEKIAAKIVFVKK